MKTEKKSTASSVLRWIDDPLIDTGVAAAVLHADVNSPEEVTWEQWQAFMEALRKDYLDGLLKKQTGILFTTNSFDNPAFKGEKRKAAIEEAFGLVNSPPDVENATIDRCAFFQEFPAVIRAARDQFPMVQGRNQVNFYPSGRAEIPLSGIAYGCLLAIPQVLPVVSGRMPVVAMESKDLLRSFLFGWYEQQQTDLAKARLHGTALPERKGQKTRVAQRLDDIFAAESKLIRDLSRSTKRPGVILYFLSNSSQGCAIDIYSLQPMVSRFLIRVNMADLRQSWQTFVNTFWWKGKTESSDDVMTDEKNRVSNNSLYDDLYSLPTNVQAFLRRYFQRYAENLAGQRKNLDATPIKLWDLLSVFLQIVILMKKEQIEKIRILADELSGIIQKTNDKKLFSQIMGRTQSTNSYTAFRAILVRTALKLLKNEPKLLLTLDDFTEIFEDEENVPHGGFYLTRDMIRIRCLEQLKNWPALRGEEDDEVVAPDEIAIETIDELR